MFHRTARTVPALLAVLSGLFGTALGEPPTSTVTETSLRPAPESGEISALLTPGTPVAVVERRGEWIKVRIEGWLRAASLGEDPGPTVERATLQETPPAVAHGPSVPMGNAPPPPGPPTPAPPTVPPPAAGPTPPAREPLIAEIRSGVPTPAATGFPVEGLIRVKVRRLRNTSAAGTEVWLLSSAAALVAEDDPESERRLAELEAEADRLEREADRAMQKISSFTEATARHDELMDERSLVLRERRDLLATRHGRHEHLARETAVAASVADSKGWFRFPSMPPGTYTLYARLSTDDLDLEWLEPVTVREAGVQVDLDESGVRGLFAGGKKKKEP